MYCSGLTAANSQSIGKNICRVSHKLGGDTGRCKGGDYTGGVITSIVEATLGSQCKAHSDLPAAEYGLIYVMAACSYRFAYSYGSSDHNGAGVDDAAHVGIVKVCTVDKTSVI